MLPLRLPATEWEQLGGHMIRVARELGCPLPAVTLAGGVPGNARNALRGLSAFPARRGLERTASFLGMDMAGVERMTLHRFTSGLFGTSNTGTRAGAQAHAPVLRTGGMYCSRCVRAGHWDLRWKSPLTAVCLTHRCYLWSRCPECETCVAPDNVLSPFEAGDDSWAHGWSGRRPCSNFLADHRAPVAVTHLHAQQRLFRLLETAQHDHDAAAHCRDVLRWMEYLHRGTGPYPLMSGGMASAEGPVLGDLLARAVDLVDAPQSAAAHAAVVRSVVLQRAMTRRPPATPLYASMRSPDEVVASIRQVTATSLAPVRVPLPGAARDQAGLPQVIPLSLFTPDVADWLDVVGFERARMVAAVSVAARPGRRSLAAAARSLALPEALGTRAAAVLTWVEHSGGAEQYWAGVNNLRRAVVDTGIDFHRRAAQVIADDRVLEAARRSWPQLASVPSPALTVWLLDRWACQYHATVGRRTPGGRRDQRDTIDALLPTSTDVATVWATWVPPLASGRVRAAG